MHGDRVSYIDDPGPMKFPKAARPVCLALAALGAVAFLAGIFTGSVDSRQQAWAGFFVSMLFFWFLALGGAGFLAIQYVTHAKWFLVAKRLPEALASFVYRGGFALPLITLLGIAYIYPWSSSANYEEIWGVAGPTYPYEGTLKALWLSNGVHIVKMIVYVGVLAVMTQLLVRASSAKSEGPASPAAQNRLKVSILYLIIYAFVFSFFAWDMVMSIAPKWFSTMFGVYCFAGAFLSAVSVMMLIMLTMRHSTEHLHQRHMYDMGTYVMAFATFMIYIGFSQFMLIWYANIYDETFFFIQRYQGGWVALTIALPFFKWVIPFLVLMPPVWRTNHIAQGVSCGAILIGQLLDLYWIVYPAISSELLLPNAVNVLTFVGVFGFFGWNLVSYLGERSMLPVEDTELLSSVNGDYLHA